MQTTETTAPRHAAPPVPRRMDFPFGPDIPRRWFGGRALATHLANGLHLLFPAGERFFIRSVRHYLDRIEDEALREDVLGFFGQEGHHAREHQRFFDIMEEQGLEIRPFLRFYERVAYDLLEKRIFGPKMRLATTVAAEHYTAMFAERALSRDFLDAAHPALRDLLKWHAAEEIEHRAVAFDVLREVDPSYALRVGGLAVATVTLLGFWMIATAMLLRQEGTPLAELRAELREARRIGHLMDGSMRTALRDYLRRDFHPSQVPGADLADAYLESIGRRQG